MSDGESDDADAVVILPGLLCDSRMFAAQRETFDACVIDCFYGGADRIEAMADYALARMPARVALFGHSMGARVAIEIYRRAPGRVSRLALASTGVHGVAAGEADKRYGLRDLGLAKGSEALVDAWLPPMIGPLRRNDPALVAPLRAMAIDAGVHTFVAAIEALLHRPDAIPVLRTITCPTFVIVGRDDSWSPVAQHQAIAAAIPRAQLRIVDGAGHLAPAEEPARYNMIVREWLSWPTAAKASSDRMEDMPDDEDASATARREPRYRHLPAQPAGRAECLPRCSG